MRTTESFEIFPNDESERELARARWLRREGRTAESEKAYRGVMQRQPALRSSWTECFELLRSAGHIDDALQIANAASSVFPHEAFPLTLKGAALIEMRKYREALQSLEVAVERDPDLALTWHELGYASFQLGDNKRALLSLDRAFALEPHTETLILRGRILRDGGELYAAEVAFEAARHSASHDDQQVVIEHEIAVTHRAGTFPPRWIREPTEGEAWFAEHGTVVISSEVTEDIPTDDQLKQKLIELVGDCGWSFGQLVSPDDPTTWQGLGQVLGLPIEPLVALNAERTPLVVSIYPETDDGAWLDAAGRIDDEQRGLVAVVWHPISTTSPTDVVCALVDDRTPLLLGPDGSTALVMAQHPAARVAARALGPNAPAETG